MFNEKMLYIAGNIQRKQLANRNYSNLCTPCVSKIAFVWKVTLHVFMCVYVCVSQPPRLLITDNVYIVKRILLYLWILISYFNTSLEYDMHFIFNTYVTLETSSMLYCYKPPQVTPSSCSL